MHLEDEKPVTLSLDQVFTVHCSPIEAIPLQDILLNKKNWVAPVLFYLWIQLQSIFNLVNPRVDGG